MLEVKTLSRGTSTDIASERRRSHRVNIAMPVLVRGRNGERPFEEAGNTVSVSAHGCMVRLAVPLTKSQELVLVSKTTGLEALCTVTFLGKKEGSKAEVGLEFNEPSPRFWRITFPPDDWDPAERKLPGNHSPKERR